MIQIKEFRRSIAAMLVAAAAAPAGAAPQLGTDPLADVIGAMSLQEKVALVHGAERALDTSSEPTVGMSANERVPGAAGHTVAIPRLGIPSVVLADGPAGLRIAPERKGAPGRTFHATAFPIASLLASSWDTELVERVGRAIGGEARAYGVDVLLAPAMNIHRYALGGRNFEYFSEDPLVSGEMAAAYVRGVQSQGVGTALKHYVANNHEWNRSTIDVVVGERALREIYLRGYEIAVKESGPWTVMSSYNKVNGEYTSQSQRLLTTILRDQWGFDGLVMTDWFGGRDAGAQQRAGNDLLMPGMDVQRQAVLAAAKSGELNMAVLDRNVANVLRLVERSRAFAGAAYSNDPPLEDHAAVARRAASEGMILLKNQGETLPLPAGAKLALLGNYSYHLITGGTGSGDVNEAYTVSLLQGLENAGFELDRPLAGAYQAHVEREIGKWPQPKNLLETFMPKPQIPEMHVEDRRLDALARTQDIAVMTIGRTSGEFADREPDNFPLGDAEIELIDRVSKAFREQGKPVVVILNIGGVIEVASWQDKVDAILLAYQGGQEAGNAIADVLTGDVNPSGRLIDTFPKALADYPAHEGFPGEVTDDEPVAFGVLKAQPSRVTYDDGIRVGYRHFNTRDQAVAYPFGHGLSYTRFEYRDPELSGERFDAGIEVAVTVENVGEVAGREVVQLYVAAPGAKLEKPAEELRAFAKTRVLAPGESQTLSFALTARDLASFDPALGRWAVEKGRYRVKAAASSRDVRSNVTFTVANDQTIEP